MPITKTGLTVTTTGERAISVEEDGQQSSLSVTGLAANKLYTAVPYIVDSDFGRIEGRPYTFNTMPVGQVTLSNISGIWQNNSTLIFSCKWTSTYPVTSDVNNCKLIISMNSEFSPKQELSPRWSTNGNAGQISIVTSAYLPTTVVSGTYYIKVKMIDTYGETIYSPVVEFALPTSGVAGSMSFTVITSTEDSFYFRSNISPNEFTYYPYVKRIVYSTDNWATEQTTRNFLWYNNNDVFESFEPNFYKVEMVVGDCYGEQFRTNQGTEINIVGVTSIRNTTRGTAFYLVKLNPNLHYTDVGIHYESTDGQGIVGFVDLLPLSSYNLSGTIPLPTGTYRMYAYAFYGTSDVYISPDFNLTITNLGWLDLVNTSTVDENLNLSWSADFDSEYVLTGTCTLNLFDENYNEIGTYTAEYDQNVTNGSMWLNQTVNVAGYDYVDCSVTVRDVEGNSLYADFWVYDGINNQIYHSNE